MSNSDDTVGPVIVLGLFAALVIFAIRRARKRPRFIIDERGERQHVAHWNRGQPVYTPKTWQQRVHEEAVLRSERRKTLLALLIIMGPLVGFALWLREQSEVAGNIVLAIGASASLSTAANWLPALVNEIRYNLGDQGMEGAPVLDKAPKAQPGREIIESQKAHGDARLASEAEAVSLLTSKK